jgi:cell division protein FtsL
MLILGALAMTLASAFLLYGLNYDTRLLESRVQAQERAIEQARSDIAVLKAERAHLGRPDRIEPLARAQGLRPATEQQLVASPEAALARVQGETAGPSPLPQTGALPDRGD